MLPLLDTGAKFRGVKPKVLSPNLWAAKPGDEGGFEIASEKDPKPGESGGCENTSDNDGPNLGDGRGFGNRQELEEDANPESVLSSSVEEVVLKISMWLKHPNRPGSELSSLCPHEKVEGADDGPGEIAGWSGVELPRGLPIGDLSGLVHLIEPSSSGKGAVRGSLGTSMASTDKVILCFEGLRPLRGLYAEPGDSFLFATSF